jgi:hypothetical protein
MHYINCKNRNYKLILINFDKIFMNFKEFLIQLGFNLSNANEDVFKKIIPKKPQLMRQIEDKNKFELTYKRMIEKIDSLSPIVAL